MADRKLISEAYLAQQAALHEGGKYGVAARGLGHSVMRYVERVGAKSILDYGCGSKRSLLSSLVLPHDVSYDCYDPCVPEFAGEPFEADLVVCFDVLEHIEPECLDNVLDHLRDLCHPYGLFTVHTGPAMKTLADGRNAHLTQQDKTWWRAKFATRFDLLEGGSQPGGFFIFVRSKPT